MSRSESSRTVVIVDQGHRGKRRYAPLSSAVRLDLGVSGPRRARSDYNPKVGQASSCSIKLASIATPKRTRLSFIWPTVYHLVCGSRLLNSGGCVHACWLRWAMPARTGGGRAPLRSRTWAHPEVCERAAAEAK